MSCTGSIRIEEAGCLKSLQSTGIPFTKLWAHKNLLNVCCCDFAGGHKLPDGSADPSSRMGDSALQFVGQASADVLVCLKKTRAKQNRA